MSLFRSSLRPPAILSDEAIERYLAAIRTEIEPDPLFRRRLRGHVMNRYVAAREGQASGRGPAREMGRLGRAVLYASFALGLSVTGAMATSQQSIPGDPLYAVKLRIEALRLQVVPDRLHGDLAAYTLGERLEEMRRLAESGNWSAADAHAAVVDAAYEQVVALSPDGETLARHLEVAGALFDRLPEQAQAAVERALFDSPGHGHGLTSSEGGRPDGPPSSSGGGGGGSGTGNGQGQDPSGNAADDPPDAGPPDSPGTSSSGEVQPTPRAEPQAPEGPGPTESPKPTKSPKATKTPTPTKSPNPAGN